MLKNKMNNNNTSKQNKESTLTLLLRLIKYFFAQKKQGRIIISLKEAKLEDLTWRFPNLKFKKEDYFLARFKNGKFQAVNKKFDLWRYGDWLELRKIEMVLKISEIPSEWWLTIEDNGRPSDNSIVLLSYNDNHYEVAEYNNFNWVTQLSFPVKFSRYLIIKSPAK
jgi:hypothetical protein